MADKQYFARNPCTTVDSMIEEFEKVIINKYGANLLGGMKDRQVIDNHYEIPSKGGILASFSLNGKRPIRIFMEDRVIFCDSVITYLGFDESSKEYKSMLSDVQKALDGK